MSKFDRPAFKGIVIYKQLLSRKFTEIKEYIEETRLFIQKKQNEIREFIGSELEGNEDKEHASVIVEFYYDDFYKYENTYTELLMNSTFITAFSTFEYSFFKICQYAQKEKDAKLSMNDLYGNSIVSKCKKYIEKVIEIDLSYFNSDWQEITNYNKVRNVLVHNSGSFKKDKDKPIEKQELYSLISRNPFLKHKNEKHGYFFINDSKFIIDFCEKAEKYLLNITDLILNIKKQTRC